MTLRYLDNIGSDRALFKESPRRTQDANPICSGLPGLGFNASQGPRSTIFCNWSNVFTIIIRAWLLLDRKCSKLNISAHKHGLIGPTTINNDRLSDLAHLSPFSQDSQYERQPAYRLVKTVAFPDMRFGLNCCLVVRLSSPSSTYPSSSPVEARSNFCMTLLPSANFHSPCNSQSFFNFQLEP